MIDNAQDRLNALMLRFKQFELETSDPKWSSFVLDRFFEEIMSTPGVSIQDLYLGLDNALKNYTVTLTQAVAAFIKDVVIRCFTRYQESYRLVNWKELVASLDDKSTEAQLYLATPCYSSAVCYAAIG